MIALDCHPFSIVDDEGFINLIRQLEPRYTIPSRKYITEKVVTKIYMDLKEKVSCGVEYFSFTTDVWSTCVSNESLLSLIAHWIRADTFSHVSVMWNTSRLEGFHTGACIAEKIGAILESWSILSDQVHVV